QRLIAAAGLTRIPAPNSSPGTPAAIVATGGTPPGHRAYVNFIVGDHGSIIDPTASLAATAEMQSESVFFAAGFPPPFPVIPPGLARGVTSPRVIEPWASGAARGPRSGRAV